MNHAQKRAAAQAIPFHLPFPRRICCSSHQPSAVSGQPHRCLRCCFCFCLSGCHSRRESAVPRRPQPLPTRDHRERHRANAPPLHAMLIPEGNLLFPSVLTRSQPATIGSATARTRLRCMQCRCCGRIGIRLVVWSCVVLAASADPHGNFPGPSA